MVVMHDGRVLVGQQIRSMCLVIVRIVSSGCVVVASIAISRAIAQPYLPTTRAFDDGSPLGGDNDKDYAQ